jgi:predicted molibdopterin-dependent oxidoreductase YjgC
MNLSPEDRVPPNAPAGRRTGPTPAGRPLHFTFDGREVLAYEGETVAAALLAAGQRVLRLTGRRGEPRGLFCGMGVCFDCLVQVDGRPNVRACQTPAAEGLRVETQRGSGSWEVPP